MNKVEQLITERDHLRGEADKIDEELTKIFKNRVSVANALFCLAEQDAMNGRNLNLTIYDLEFPLRNIDEYVIEGYHDGVVSARITSTTKDGECEEFTWTILLTCNAVDQSMIVIRERERLFEKYKRISEGQDAKSLEEKTRKFETLKKELGR